MLNLLRLILGVITFTLPGYLVVMILFNKKTDIMWIERITLSMTISIGIIILPIMALNYMGMQITELNVIATITAITTLMGITAIAKKNYLKAYQ